MFTFAILKRMHVLFLLPDRLMAGQLILVQFVEVRILLGQHLIIKHPGSKARGVLFPTQSNSSVNLLQGPGPDCSTSHPREQKLKIFLSGVSKSLAFQAALRNQKV
jgi:hypothetical protein